MTLGIACIIFLAGMFLGRNSVSSPKSESAPRTVLYTTDGSVAESFVNINTADAETLQHLPGIGEVLAERIVAYRENSGSFRSILELLDIEGIGQTKLENIMDLICLED